ncbi:MAG: nickel-dependent hydrogenase large subunit [Burkholderiales bacterium]
MSAEGELFVRLHWTGARVEGVRIRSTRRDAASRVLKGRPPADALAWIPRVFSICARAQEAAARLALANAGAGIAPAPDTGAVRREIVDESFFRLLIDWPRAVGVEPDAKTVAQARTMDDPGLGELARHCIFGEPASEWLERDRYERLLAWTATAATLPARLLGLLLRETPALGRSDVALMPPPTRASIESKVLAAMSRDPEYARAPTWDGAPVETGAIVRMRSHPLVAAVIERDGLTAAARMTARLAELAHLVATGALPHAEGFSSSAGEGVGAVETARGFLLHQARIAGGRVADYRILAPTEWNFHPQGALARGLSGMTARDGADVERLARIAVHALDPCVACVIEVAHA